MSSKAFAEFTSTLALAHALQKLESGYQDPPTPGEVEVVGGLRGGAVVLMVGAFENFARSAIEEHIEPFARAAPQKILKNLPTEMQVAAIFASLERAMKGPRWGQPGGRVARLPFVIGAAELIAAGRLDSKALSSVDGNVDADGLGALLKAIGMKDCFAKVRPYFDAEWNKVEAQQFVQDKLNSIVQSRHRVAHTASVLGVSRVDVSEGLRFLEALAASVDKCLCGPRGHAVALAVEIRDRGPTVVAAEADESCVPDGKRILTVTHAPKL